jgi:predicted nuclease of restriction endonuclease-like (RecB) superfamily
MSDEGLTVNQVPQESYQTDFSKIYKIIEEARSRTWRQVNKSLIALYWDIGKYVSLKSEQEGWGKSIVEQLSDYILSQQSSVKGFSARNIWRMKQFYETYKDHEKLSTLLTEIEWSNHLHILSKTKTIEEKEFYLNLLANHRYSVRDFERLIDSATYERTIIGNKNLSTALTEFPFSTSNMFKDIYTFEFLSLPEAYKENDLRKALLKNLRQFLLEMGPDFSLMGEEYIVQVGGKDFRIDLLLHNRALNCLAAVELKITEFQPEYLGKMQFYLEALDRDVKKSHEHPSIGILICKTKDEEVVKYALSRNISPTMIAEYETKLLDKTKLQRKLHELVESWESLNSTHINSF